jgi:hypothetical protein
MTKKPKAKAKTGRPTSYSAALRDRICSLIAQGSNLNRVSEQDDMPSRETLYAWLAEKTDFSDNYARAREDRADWRSDRIDDYVRQMLAGEIDPAAARVAIDAEKWQAGKEKPKRYGEFQRTELSTADDKPLKMDVTVTPAEAYARALKR